MPAFITGLGMDLLLVVHSSNPLIPEPVRRICLIIGITGFFFTLLFFYLLVPLTEHYPYLKFIFSLSTGILIGLLAYIDVEYVGELSFIYINVIVLITSILFGRSSTYALLFSTVITGTVVSIGLRQLPLADVWMHELSLLAIGTVINETQWRMNKVLYRQLQRLEAINRISRNVSSSIETAEVLSLLSASIQNTLDADTYFIALWNEDKLELQLLYDDGIFFPNTELDPENTLSGWVIKNNKPLLIGDVLEEASAIGILPTTIGQPKLSRSWLGVPLETSDLKLGIVVVAAYQPDKYDQGDLDLLQNIAQQAALAIDNAYHHAQVEKRSQQDSLTSALTHGYFLEVMQKAANECLESGAPLSLIMLDIDYFKLYNDHHGHLVGDQVLCQITDIIRSHVKYTDMVGRWGGEEFAVGLPNANGEQAIEIAKRIQRSIQEANLSGRDNRVIATPTVSQGIAVYPSEAQSISNLIDLADQRLYRAKARGRNQIEPRAYPSPDRAGESET